MLIKHIAANDDAHVVVDSDVDGFTSSALLINYLNCLFPHWTQTHLSYSLHSGKEHGIEDAAISPWVSLIIAPDSSSNEESIHKKYFDNNIDVLVLDHHLCDNISNYACVINNQLCDYPNKDFSGVGIVYKFCQYIDELMNTNYCENYLDLVSLGLISDMMDSRNYETQYYI